MQRLLSLILLLCFGVIAPLQGMPFRLCLLDNNAPTPGITESGLSRLEGNECCGSCGAKKAEQHRSDCCVEVEQQGTSTPPRVSEHLTALELPVTILLTLEWITLFRPAVADQSHPPTWEHFVPKLGNDRQAVLSIWTV